MRKCCADAIAAEKKRADRAEDELTLARADLSREKCATTSLRGANAALLDELAMVRQRLGGRDVRTR